MPERPRPTAVGATMRLTATEFVNSLDAEQRGRVVYDSWMASGCSGTTRRPIVTVYLCEI